MNFNDIPQFPFATYHVNISWSYLERWLFDHADDCVQANLDPEYQRGYVWTEEQKVAYIEYRLMGGFSGRDIFWNCPTWMNFKPKGNVIELVDGKQRVQAVLDFLHNKIKAFGLLYSEFEGSLGLTDFVFHVNNLKKPVDVVNWYLGMNTGGSIHTKEDLAPARLLLKKLEGNNEVC